MVVARSRLGLFDVLLALYTILMMLRGFEYLVIAEISPELEYDAQHDGLRA